MGIGGGKGTEEKGGSSDGKDHHLERESSDTSRSNYCPGSTRILRKEVLARGGGRKRLFTDRERNKTNILTVRKSTQQQGLIIKKRKRVRQFKK